jgi:hypothetical protein
LENLLIGLWKLLREGTNNNEWHCE